MTSDEQYFRYLKTRSQLALLYRRWWLYPRLARRLRGRTLDIGCGVGDLLAYRPNTVGVDVNSYAVRHCRALGLDAHQMQPDVLPFADGSFDSAVLDNVLEHIVFPNPLLAEVRRVVRADGTLIVGVPGIRGWKCDADHKVFYGEAELRARIESAGFRWIDTFFSPLSRSRWLDRGFRLYVIWCEFERD